jgi:hypothetical protein
VTSAATILIYYVVTASNAIGQSLNSNQAIATMPLPALTIANSVASVAISWPATATPVKLYSTASLATPIAWSPVTNAVQSSGGTSALTLPAADGNQFFRLGPP